MTKTTSFFERGSKQRRFHSQREEMGISLCEVIMQSWQTGNVFLVLDLAHDLSPIIYQASNPKLNVSRKVRHNFPTGHDVKLQTSHTSGPWLQ